MKRGPLIVLEGMVGCGKTTQVNTLKDYLDSKKINYVYGREPGGVPVAERIRDLVLNPANVEMHPLTAVYLFSAARTEFIAKFVGPELESERLVLTDRSYLSTLAFQGHGQGVNLDLIRRHANDAVQGYHPDLALILDVNNVEDSMIRARRASTKAGQPDRFEAEAIAFHTRVRDGYREIAKDRNIKLIPSHENIEDINTRIVTIRGEIIRNLESFLEEFYKK